MTVGERIKQRRTELSMSVETLADLLGKNRATVYRYESDEIENLPISIIEPLARALNTTPAYLMGWSDDFKLSMLNNSLSIKDINSHYESALGRLKEGKQISSAETELLVNDMPRTLSSLSSQDIQLSSVSDSFVQRMLMYYMRLLNSNGKEEAFKRLQELTCIPKYKNDQTDNHTIAPDLKPKKSMEIDKRYDGEKG